MDKSIMSLVNKSTILDIIREKSPIYRAEISRITNLSIPTVMKITDSLISKGLVIEGEIAKSTGGKPPRLLSFAGDSMYIIGIDIGTTNINVILMDLDANMLSSYQQPTSAERHFNEVVAQVVYCIDKIIATSKIDIAQILGIGIGMPGVISPESGKILLSPAFGWKDKDLLKELRQHFNLPMRINNVTKSMAMGELYFGLGHNINNYICVNLGYGIGSAIVINHRIYNGDSGASGELGHVIVEQNGPKCSCGNYGCLEAVASANAISKQAQAAIKSGAVSMISSMVQGDLKKIDAKIIFEAAAAGDPLANTILHQAIVYLGSAIGSAINFIDPAIIILEGGVSRAGDLLLSPLIEEVNHHVMPVKKCDIVISKLGIYCASIGAATFLLDELIKKGGEMIR
ncbi:MAG: ROK family transcriptional regulator [Lachnospiraceae bacterium]|nr:ROK family transcriptional regulator [Lachnospiraceae bacterium]